MPCGAGRRRTRCRRGRIRTRCVYKEFRCAADGRMTGRRVADERDSEDGAQAVTDADYRNLAETLPQLAWIAEADGTIVWYNQRWYDYTGTPWRRCAAGAGAMLHHPDHVDAVTERFQAAILLGAVLGGHVPAARPGRHLSLVPVQGAAAPRRGRADPALVRHQHRHHPPSHRRGAPASFRGALPGAGGCLGGGDLEHQRGGRADAAAGPLEHLYRPERGGLPGLGLGGRGPPRRPGARRRRLGGLRGGARRPTRSSTACAATTGTGATMEVRGVPVLAAGRHPARMGRHLRRRHRAEGGRGGGASAPGRRRRRPTAPRASSSPT